LAEGVVPSAPVFSLKSSALRCALAPAAVFLLALLFRSLYLDRSLSADEVRSALVAAQDIPGVLRESLHNDSHPPLYYLLLHLWITVSKWEIWVRLPSVLSGAALASVSYMLAQEAFGRRFGFTTGLLMVFSSRSVVVSQIARSYALQSLFINLSLLWMVRAIRHGRAVDWVKHTIAAALAIYTFYFSLLGVLLNGIAVLLFHRKKRVLWPWMWSQIVLFLCFLPLFSLFLHQSAEVNRVAALDSQVMMFSQAAKNHVYIALTHLPGIDYRLILPPLPGIKALWPALLLTLIATFAIRFLRRDEGAFGLCLTHVFGIFPVTLLLQRFNLIFVTVNYFAYIIPWLLVFIAAGIFEMGRKTRWAYAVLLVVLSSNLVGMVNHYSDRGGDFRAATAHIDRLAGDDDLVCTVADFIATCYRHYTTRRLRTVGLPGEIPGATPGMTMHDDQAPALLSRLLSGHLSVWMMYAHVSRGPEDRGKNRAREVLFQNGFHTDAKMCSQFGGVEVEVFRAKQEN